MFLGRLEFIVVIVSLLKLYRDMKSAVARTAKREPITLLDK